MRGQRPLYQAIASEDLGQDHRRNAGLWYDKFCDQWRRNQDKQGPYDWSLEAFQERRGNETHTVAPKDEWIDQCTGQVGDDELLGEHASRYLDLIDQGRGKALLCQTTERLISGLGRDHPVENGFVWHHTLGTPYIPGSGVKGLVRDWAEQWNTECDNEREERERILGMRSADGAGAVIFGDAIPVSRPKLGKDVMTPHYAEYYASGDEVEAPGDWMSTNPNPFLVVEEKAKLLFGLLPRNPTREQDRADCIKARCWLAYALEWLGIGAKTAVGYGRMEADKKGLDNRLEQRRQERERARQEAAEERAFLAKLQGLPGDAAALMRSQHRHDWANREVFLDDAESFLNERATLSPEAWNILRETIETPWPGIMQDPDAKTGRKGHKPKYRSSRARELARQLIKRAPQ